MPVRPREAAEELIELLSEQAAPSTPKEWFQTPWHDGMNAIALSNILANTVYSALSANSLVEEILQFSAAEYHETGKVEAYWKAQELKESCPQEVAQFDYMFIAILNMIQKWASHSDGGGALYNTHLQGLCEKFLEGGGEVDMIEPVVRRWRARDAVGVSILDVASDHEPKDANIQKRLRAFEQAWVRGLYKVAYCV